MPVFSNRSKAALETCHCDLQILLNAAIKHVDFSVLEGHRGRAAQDAAFAGGFSKVKWPNGKHNKTPSMAVDIAPYPIVWGDTERFVLFAGFLLGIAASMDISIRWGGDWDRDTQVKDEKFRDLGHFELI